MTKESEISLRDRPDEPTEIEITPAMLDAGSRVLMCRMWDLEAPSSSLLWRQVVAEILEAMLPIRLSLDLGER